MSVAEGRCRQREFRVMASERGVQMVYSIAGPWIPVGRICPYRKDIGGNYCVTGVIPQLRVHGQWLQGQDSAGEWVLRRALVALQQQWTWA